MRLVVAVILVVGLLLAVVELDAKQPPTRNIAIPIYLGDPDDVDCSRPRGSVDVRVALFVDWTNWSGLGTFMRIEKWSAVVDREVVRERKVRSSSGWERIKR